MDFHELDDRNRESGETIDEFVLHICLAILFVCCVAAGADPTLPRTGLTGASGGLPLVSILGNESAFSIFFDIVFSLCLLAIIA